MFAIYSVKYVWLYVRSRSMLFVEKKSVSIVILDNTVVLYLFFAIM